MRGFSRFMIRCTFAIAFFLVTSSAPSFAQQAAQGSGRKELTVQRIYGGSSLNGHQTAGIAWAPDGQRLSYLEHKDGGTELWTMDATTGERKVLVNREKLKELMQPEKTKAIQATGLARLQAENYFWSPDGNSLLFAGGDGLVLLNLKTMSPKSLARGEDDVEDPKFSPDGKWVSFVRNSNLWIVNVATGERKALTTGGSEEILKGKLDWVYPEELEVETAYWWSPDSSRIAYFEMDERPVTRYPIQDMSSSVGAMEYTRFPQAGEANPIVRVGTISVTGGETIWMDTGANKDVYLPRVDWLRDSKRIAIQRQNRAQNRVDLLFCDAATGASQTIRTESDKYWINLSHDLYFFSDNQRFLWSSERSGFRHYYVYDLSGKQIDQLTSGDWEVKGAGGIRAGTIGPPVVDEKNGYLYFLSNKDDVRETQLYRVSLRDKSITRITKNAGTHATMISPNMAAFVDTYSNTMTPTSQMLDRIDGTQIAAINENRVPELADYHLSPIEFLNVSAEDGTKFYASMIKPPDFDPSKKYPVLVHVYGGPHAQLVRNYWGGSEFLWHEMMAQKGYIIFTLDNHGMYGRGHAFETPMFHHFGKVELEDQLTGVKYLKSLPYVDGSRIGIWGWSFGGFMTLNAMFNAADVFKAGVSVAPVSNWRLYDTIYTERYMGRPQDNSEGYTNSSPANHAGNLQGKLMLAHGTGDDNVHFANTSEALNHMIDSGKYPDTLMIFPGRGHPISDAPAHIQLFERITQFLLKNL